jgi:hypothetical protein
MDESPVPDAEHSNEVNDADALEQAQVVTETERWSQPHTGIEVPEADAVEQAIEVTYDEDEAR